MCRTPEKTAPPPFPLRTVGLLLLITLSDSIVITFLMPMVPFMVRNYGVAEKDVGFSAGSLASAYNLAGLFSGLFWGRISDTYGRRPVLLFGLLSTGATVVWFGLAGSLSSAITARVVGGLLNSNQAVTRAMLREVTPEAHRARAFASVGQAWRRPPTLSSLSPADSPRPAPSSSPSRPPPHPHLHCNQAWGIGFFLGPLVGGLLSRPADTVPFLRGTIFDASPYPPLLPEPLARTRT